LDKCKIGKDLTFVKLFSEEKMSLFTYFG